MADSPQAYRLGPKDVLTLTIFAGGEKQREVELSVSEEGMLNVPFIGPIRAEGLTVTELEPLIRAPLAADYFVSPDINIRIEEYHSLQFFISGAVNDPGMYETDASITLMELIAKAGGVLSERGHLAYIMRDSERGEGQTPGTEKDTVKVDLKRLLDKGDMTQNVALRPGDVVYIPHKGAQDVGESKVYIGGEVEKPGVYEFQYGLTALNACIMAGGFGKFAAPNRTRIIRREGNKQITIKVDLNDVKEGKIPDVELKPGDRIHVPETWL